MKPAKETEWWRENGGGFEQSLDTGVGATCYEKAPLVSEQHKSLFCAIQYSRRVHTVRDLRW